MSSVMEYNGYRAKIEFDSKDSIFVGTVIGLNDMLGFHGHSVEELLISFKNCIDNYLAWCKEVGKEPEKEFRGMFNVRITPDAHREAALEAAIEGITMNQFVSDAINEKIARCKATMV